MNDIPRTATRDVVNDTLQEMQTFIASQFQLLAERYESLEQRIASLEEGMHQMASPPLAQKTTPTPPNPPPPPPKSPKPSFMYSTMPRRPFLKALVESQATERDGSRSKPHDGASWAPRVKSFASVPRTRPALLGSALVPQEASDANGQWVTATAVPWTGGGAGGGGGGGGQQETLEALIDAAKEGRLEDLRTLLESGADPNAEGVHGHKALRWAVRNNNADCAIVILEAGANVADPDYLGKTSLHRAAVLGHAEIVRVLLEFGGDVRARDHSGNTALHDAASYGHVDCVTALLRAGGSAHDKNEAGESPQGLAMRHEHEECAEVLRSGGRV